VWKLNLSCVSYTLSTFFIWSIDFLFVPQCPSIALVAQPLSSPYRKTNTNIIGLLCAQRRLLPASAIHCKMLKYLCFLQINE
jgi:hypothetical protein